MEEVPRFEIAVLDDVVAFAILTIADGRDRLDPVVARVERRHRDGEVVAAALAGPRKGEAGRWGRRAPSGRQLKRQQSTRSLFRIVRKLDANLDGPVLAPSTWRRTCRNDGRTRRHVHSDGGDDHQLAELLAVGQMGLAPPHGRSNRDRHTGDQVAGLRRQQGLCGRPVRLRGVSNRVTRLGNGGALEVGPCHRGAFRHRGTKRSPGSLIEAQQAGDGRRRLRAPGVAVDQGDFRRLDVDRPAVAECGADLDLLSRHDRSHR